MPNSVVPTWFLCCLLAKQNTNPAVLQWECWLNDYFYLSKAAGAFSSAHPNPHDCALPALHPTAGRPPSAVPLYLLTPEGKDSPEEKSVMPWDQQEGTEGVWSKLEYHPYSSLATAGLGKFCRQIRWFPSIMNSNLVQGKDRICRQNVYLLWSLQCEIRVGLYSSLR